MAQGTHLSAYRESARETGERSAEELRHDIAVRREVIADTVDKLSERVHQTLDWRKHVAERPLLSLGVVTALGFLLGGKFFKPRPSPRERIVDALSETVEELTDRLREQLDQVQLRRPGLSSNVKAAAAGMLTKAITDYLGNQLRGETARRQRAAQDSVTDYHGRQP